jgi:cytochrome c-type biogenesis protein CcmE
MKRKNLKFLIGGLVVAAVVVYLAVGGVREGMVYYLTVSEFYGKVPTLGDQGVRVSGKVAKGSIERDATNLNINFVITDGKENLPVFYHGVVPDIFGEDIEVVVEGKFSPEGSFRASNLLTKCPSKFEGKS